MLSDFFFILYWWLLLFGIGIIFLPLTFHLFGRFWDQGYSLAKILGILLVSYLIWIFGSLKILPFSMSTIWLVIIFGIATNWWLLKKWGLFSWIVLKEQIVKNWKTMAGEEILFFVALAFWTIVRGFQPAIQGLEKFMDFGFVNSILRSQFFPPEDMWLAGSTINYYYFGHLVSAVLTKLSGLDPAVTYNLLLGTLFALILTAGFSVGSNLIFAVIRNTQYAIRKPMKFVILGGFLSAALLTLGGNLHALYWWLTHHNFASYWYPDATRFIVEQFGAADNTIHEFPIYSFVVADLHGHLLNLPFVLLFLALSLTIFIQKKLTWSLGILASLLLGVFYITNAWDLPIYFGVLGLVILWINFQKYKITPRTLSTTILSAAGILLLAVIFSLPFHLNFRSITSGVALTDFHSPPWMLLVLWGFPLFITASFGIFLIAQKRLTSHISRLTDIFILFLLFISWALIVVPEIFYLKDIYIHSYQRANTMFKLTYQSFVMFSLANAYIVVRILTSLKKSLVKFLFVISYLLLVSFVFIYPYFATRSYYGLKNYLGIYGLNYLKDQYPDDYQAILWLNKNVAGQPVIVEAVGESYTDFARVSANTGLPTILGWRVHEWLWRGSFDQPGAKTEEVRKIYESEDLAETQELLNKYQVRYVFLGTMETRAYPQLNEEKFTKLGKVIFRQGQSKIYQID